MAFRIFIIDGEKIVFAAGIKQTQIGIVRGFVPLIQLGLVPERVGRASARQQRQPEQQNQKPLFA